MPIVTSQVVANIYRGIDFPMGWDDKPDGDINLGMTRNLLVAVAAMFDANLNPVALCWCVDGREERFACVRPGEAGDSSLLDELNRDLAGESLGLGSADLLATMLWAPDEIRPDQGQPVSRVVFVQSRYGGLRGWNIATRSLVAKAGSLLFMTRTVCQGLEFPVPASIGEMHQRTESAAPSDTSPALIVLPGAVAVDVDRNSGRKMALLFGGLVVLSVLITAYLLHPA